MKTCRECGNTLPLSEFYTHPTSPDGHFNKCKACVKQRVKAYRLRNLEKVRAYDRARDKFPDRNKNRSKIGRQYRENFPERIRANRKLQTALDAGLIQRLPCWVCGCEITVGHHPAYSMPLDVVWLCQSHHRQLHAEAV